MAAHAKKHRANATIRTFYEFYWWDGRGDSGVKECEDEKSAKKFLKRFYDKNPQGGIESARTVTEAIARQYKEINPLDIRDTA